MMAQVIKCHYEVLGVDRDASTDDLKKSYKRLALKYHPDKNPDNVEEATAQFRIVQQAYEVLTDPQERAWYDKHREAILRGGLGRGEAYDDNSLDVFQYFNSSCYSGYGEDDKGFYNVYAKVFETLAEEDYEFMPDREDDEEFPKFGGPDADYEEIVGPFYAFWSSFCTQKSYVWAEKYDTREAPDRRVRRAMEQENKKLREAAKKERNEEIRNLVAYVKKRDKRVQIYKKKLEERHAEIERKTKEKRAEEIRERQKQLENYQEAGWSAMSELEKDLQQLEAHLDQHFYPEDIASDYQPEVGEPLDVAAAEDEVAELYSSDLYCVACNKAFKSEKAFSNHEKSRKHKDMIAAIQEEMRLEEAAAVSSGDKQNETNAHDHDRLGGLESDKQAPEMDPDVDIEEELELSSEEEEQKLKLSKKQKKKRRQKNLLEAEEDILAEKVAEVKLSAEESPSKSASKSKKSRRKAAKLAELKDDEGDVEDDLGLPSSSPQDFGLQEDITECDKVESGAGTAAVDRLQNGDYEDIEEGESKTLTSEMPVDNKAEGKSKTKNKKASSNKSQEQVVSGSSSGNKTNFKCNKCQRAYQTRNQLFEHIKQTGHALRLEGGNDAAVGEEEELNERSARKGKKGKKEKR